MFKIKSFTPRQSNIRTIEKEMEMSRARYQEYLNTTSDKYMAQRGDVKVKDPHTMAGGAYNELRDSIDSISLSAKKANKEVTFEDARALTRDDELVSPVTENYLSSKVLITVKDKLSGNILKDRIDRFEQPEIPFMKKISNALGEMFTGKKGANIDSDLGLK